ncbi:MAG TPA: FkbM family methyltransferase [Vicinamibacteria bacterium]|jgi:FkbM family methyltransferase|nr:FkbM family methyltransferase [Vicinamibacteria bacterium]
MSRRLGFNKACEIEDFADPELASFIRDVCRHKLVRFPSLPDGVEHSKDWEEAMAIRALREFGALRPDSRILGVAAGKEDTLFYLTRHVQQVFATDLYLWSGDWSSTSPLSMLVQPELAAPYACDPNRLVVQHMDARSLRFPDNTFDGIFSSCAIEHFGDLQDIASAAYEMGRVLKPGGLLAISTTIKLGGPPGGIGWPGQTLIFPREDLQRYIVEASGLEPVDELRTDVSEETLSTERDLVRAVLDYRARLDEKGEAGRETEYALWDFPMVVLAVEGYVFTSVHLALRKTDRHPLVANDWARPSAATQEAIRRTNRDLVSRALRAFAPALEEKGNGKASAPVAPTPLLAPTPAPPPGLFERPWEERNGEAQTRLTQVRHFDSDAARLGQEHSERASVLERTVAEIDDGLSLIGRVLEGEEGVRAAARARAHPSPAASRSAAAEGRRQWTTHPVRLEGGPEFVVVVDPASEDAFTAAYVGGNGAALNETLVRLMLDLVRAGDVVVDLGAHLGSFALPAAAVGCKVLAVEAAPHTAALLQASATRNGFRNLKVIQAAAADAPGSLEFCPRGPQGHVATPLISLPTIAVPAVTVDEVLLELGWGPVAFVKMDIEGSEIGALRGMSRVLGGTDAPSILYESNGHTLAFQGATPERLRVELESRGYQSWLVEPRRLVRLAGAEFQPQTLVDCLAIKRWPERLNGRHREGGLTVEEKIARIVADCRDPNEDVRVYMARALAEAGPLRAHPAVTDALTGLLQDEVPSVRAACAWWSPAQGQGG